MKTQPKTACLPRGVALASLLATSLSLAQTTPSGSSAAATAPGENRNEEDAVILSPFEVTSEGDVGYAATSTLAGSRLNTPLKDTAASIGVLTAELLADIGATDLTEALAYANNVQIGMADDTSIGAAPNENFFFNPAPGFRIRGVRATVTRNYFEWTVDRDLYNVERIEESRGPNSILFGIGSAGGIINSSTKQPQLTRTFRHAGVEVESFDGYRGTLDLNQSLLDGKMAFRLNTVYDHAGTFRTYGFSTRRGVHLATKVEVTPTTRFRVEYETGDKHANIASGNSLIDASLRWLAAGRPTYPGAVAANSALGLARYGNAARITYIGNNDTLINMAGRNSGSGTSITITDPTIADRNINCGGPGQLQDSFYTTYSAFIEQQLGSNSFLELAFNHQDTNTRTHQSNAANLSFDPNLTLANGAPNAYGGGLMIESNWVRRQQETRSDDLRMTVSTEFDLGKWGSYRLAGMAEYERRVALTGAQIEAWADRPFNSSPENAANQVFRRNYVTEGDWDTYYVNSPTLDGLIQGMTDPVTRRTLSSTWVAQNQNQQDDPNRQTTYLLGVQARYFDDRLVVGAGYRHDKLEIDDRGARRNPETNQWEVDYGNVTELSYTGRTKTIGAVYDLNRNVSLIYNRANNFSLPNANVRILPDSLPGGNPEGEGEDIGLSFSLLDGRLDARAVYYKSSSVGQTAPHGFGSSNTSPTAMSENVLNALLAEGLITAAEADARRVTANGASYDVTSEGYEFSLTANLTKSWTLRANYSKTSNFEENIGVEVAEWAAEILPYFKQFPQDVVTANGNTIAQVITRFEEAMDDQFANDGEDSGGNRKHKVSFNTTYAFSSGPLKGAFVGGDFNYQSRNVAGRNGPQGEFLYGRSFWNAGLRVGYRFAELGRMKRLRLQLNVYNLFDEDEPLVTHRFDDGTIRRWVVIAPRTWKLSANFDF